MLWPTGEGSSVRSGPVGAGTVAESGVTWDACTAARHVQEVHPPRFGLDASIGRPQLAHLDMMSILPVSTRSLALHN